jgi:Erv1 / Alr family
MAESPKPQPGSKDSWGPKLWRVLHNLAWLSDRTDVAFLWKKLLKSLTEVMPCPICRNHLSEFISNRVIFPMKTIHLTKGPEIKERIVYNIWFLHNKVNEQNGKLEFPIELLNALYVDKTRSEILSETGRLIREINAEWEPIVLKQITGAAFREWRNDTMLLTGLLSGGPN